jgi:hypothetical protein
MKWKGMYKDIYKIDSLFEVIQDDIDILGEEYSTTIDITI